MACGLVKRCLILILLLSALACNLENSIKGSAGVDPNDNGSNPVTDPPSDPPPASPAKLQVLPLYPTNGSNWLEFVTSDGSGPYDASDSDCTGAETGGYNSCWHGGEIKIVDVPEYSTCNQLTLEDSLGAFDWVCDSSGANVVFRSRRLKFDKGLQDLISGAQWVSNKVILKENNVEVNSSDLNTWWSNPVAALTDNNGGAVLSLSTSGTIYVHESGTITTPGYNIDGDEIGLVVFEGAKLQREAASAANCDNTGEVVATNTCVLSAGSQNFLWIEGHFDGNPAGGANYALNLATLKFANLRRVLLTSSATRNFRMIGSNNNQIVQLYGKASSAVGMLFSDVDDSTIFDLQSSDDWNHAIEVNSTCSNNLFWRVRAANSGEGLRLNGSGNVVHDVIVNSNWGWGLDFDGGTATIVSAAIVAQNGHTTNRDGLNVSNATGSTFHNLMAINNRRDGIIQTDSASNSTYSNLVMAENGDDGIELTLNAANNYFTGALLANGNTTSNCNIAGAASTGLINSTCSDTGADGETSYTGALSDAIFRPNASFDTTNTFVGKIITDDVSNPNDNNGNSLYASITDWFSFDDSLRIWGKDGTDLKNDGILGNCKNAAGGNCRIWSYALKSMDTVFRNTSVDGSSQNVAFVGGGGTCPSSILSDSTSVSDRNAPANIYLLNAFEVLLDDVGDDDGLCEDNENCTYAPNFGIYQGHGAADASDYCVPSGSSFTGTKVFQFPSNGF